VSITWVVEGRNVVGLVTPELVACGEAQGIARVEDVMFRHVVTATPNLTIRGTANLLRGRARIANRRNGRRPPP
jgi:hypothetical protein